MIVDDIYTPLEEAKREIQRRWNDKKLEKKVEEFLNNDIPDFLKDSPKVMLMRQLQSPNLEFERFRNMACAIGLESVLPEFVQDIFVKHNSLKFHLGKVHFYVGKDGDDKKEVLTHEIVDFDKSQGQQIREVETCFGCKLTEFHHNMLHTEFSDTQEKIKDMSLWLEKVGKDAKEFYLKYLTLAVRNGVMFESFLLNKEEKSLTTKVVLPAIIRIEEEFGMKPLIVRLLPKETENDLSWSYYDKSKIKYVGRKQ